MLRKSDYENYDYRQFWKDSGREYEDRSERSALKKLFDGINPKGKVFADFGCGFGRLFGEYENFATVILIDYSMNNLKNARQNIFSYLKEKNSEHNLNHIFFIAADVGNLPLKSAILDVCLSVRLIHHLQEPGDFFGEVKNSVKPGGIFILEFANKRNMKNILKFLAGRLKVSPFNSEPLQIGQTILDYHPAYIKKLLKDRGFKVIKQISVSNFRLNILKKALRLNFLLFAENIYQRFFSFINTGPSIFLKTIPGAKEKNKFISTDNSHKPEKVTDRASISISEFFICPKCKGANLFMNDKITGSFFSQDGEINCPDCSSKFPVEGGIYDFRV
jgi:SAM-dependent methyltransferase/uncharacterized protein YbaR (Trm112 family)